MADVRRCETNLGGELRFGVDFLASLGVTENEELRRPSFNLAFRMDQYLDFMALKSRLEVAHPRLSGLLRREKNSRPEMKGDWEEIIRTGFAGRLKAWGFHRLSASPDILKLMGAKENEVDLWGNLRRFFEKLKNTLKLAGMPAIQA